MDIPSDESKGFQTDGPTVCDPGKIVDGQYVFPGSRYYATGGPYPKPIHTHNWLGIDTVAPIKIPNADPEWESTLMVEMWHTSDWAVYHFKTDKRKIRKVQLCLSNLKTPEKVGTPVGVYVRKPALPCLPPPHDSGLAVVGGWDMAGIVTILPPGKWQIHEVSPNVPPAPSGETLVGVVLMEGEIGPGRGKDRNVSIAWVKIVLL